MVKVSYRQQEWWYYYHFIDCFEATLASLKSHIAPPINDLPQKSQPPINSKTNNRQDHLALAAIKVYSTAVTSLDSRQKNVKM